MYFGVCSFISSRIVKIQVIRDSGLGVDWDLEIYW